MALRIAIAAALAACVLTACGGGGGGGSPDGGGGGGPVPAYANVQPAAAPAAETFNPSIATGTVSGAADTLDTAGRVAGALVELRQVLASGSLGPVEATATTGAGGTFSIAMPTGRLTSDGNWMLVAQLAGGPVRAYLHAGAVRVDASSEAWVRLVEAAAGRMLGFAGAGSATLKDIARALSLYADATGDRRAGLSLSASADWIVQSLSRDEAMNYVVSTLRTTGALPGGGVGDIGAFHALSNTYGGIFTDDEGQQVVITTRDFFGTTKAPDGSWTYTVAVSTLVNGQLTPNSSAGGMARTSASRSYQTLRATSETEALITGLIGEYQAQSFPVTPGARQLEARRITATQLNFTGGNDEQPLAFSLIETVGGVESVTVAAGTFRAARVSTDLEITIPTSATGVSRLLLRSTAWLAPGVGILKQTEQVFLDGVADSTATASIELSQAYASNIVWPERVSISRSIASASPFPFGCRPLVIPGTDHYVSVEQLPQVNGVLPLGLARRDRQTGLQIGEMRVFAGARKGCPMAIGSGNEILVAEWFPTRNLQTDWPAEFSAASAQSDVVHVVSGVDLSDISATRLDAVPDAGNPSLFWPAEIGALLPAPDSSRRFLVGTLRSSTSGMLGEAGQHVQVLGPGLASPRVDVGRVLVIGADWGSGSVYTMENFGALTLRQLPFTAAGGVDLAGARVVRTGFFTSQLWYASADLLHLHDGQTLRVSDGSEGPRLAFDSGRCGVRAALLVCLDSANDRLVRMNAETLAVQSTAQLGSLLRALARATPDFTDLLLFMDGIDVADESTFRFAGHEMHVGLWP